MTDWELVMAILDGLKATGYTGDVSVRMRLQDGGIRRARVIKEGEVTVAELIALPA